MLQKLIPCSGNSDHLIQFNAPSFLYLHIKPLEFSRVQVRPSWLLAGIFYVFPILFTGIVSAQNTNLLDQFQSLIEEGQLKGRAFDLSVLSKSIPIATPSLPEIYVAISTSIPPENLKKLAIDAGRANVTLVLRGFIDGSLQKTTEAMTQYAKLGASIQIYPQLFSQYGITVVPTYLAIKSSSECLANTQCSSPENGAVSGDVSLAYALRALQKTAPATLQPLITEKLALLGERP